MIIVQTSEAGALEPFIQHHGCNKGLIATATKMCADVWKKEKMCRVNDTAQSCWLTIHSCSSSSKCQKKEELSNLKFRLFIHVRFAGTLVFIICIFSVLNATFSEGSGHPVINDHSLSRLT